MTSIRFLGIAAFEITNSQDQVILIDPFLDDNPVSPVKVADLERVDLVLVTHLADDHLGDAAAISKRFDCPVVCGPEVGVFLEQQGADPHRSGKGLRCVAQRLCRCGLHRRIASLDVTETQASAPRRSAEAGRARGSC